MLCVACGLSRVVCCCLLSFVVVVLGVVVGLLSVVRSLWFLVLDVVVGVLVFCVVVCHVSVFVC